MQHFFPKYVDLQLNANKMKVVLVGLTHNLTKLVDQNISLTIGLETVQPSDGCLA